MRIDGLADEDTYRHAQPPYPVDIRARVIRVIPEQKLAALTCLKLDDPASRIVSEMESGAAMVMANPA